MANWPISLIICHSLWSRSADFERTTGPRHTPAVYFARHVRTRAPIRHSDCDSRHNLSADGIVSEALTTESHPVWNRQKVPRCMPTPPGLRKYEYPQQVLYRKSQKNRYEASGICCSEGLRLNLEVFKQEEPRIST